MNIESTLEDRYRYQAPWARISTSRDYQWYQVIFKLKESDP